MCWTSWVRVETWPCLSTAKTRGVSSCKGEWVGSYLAMGAKTKAKRVESWCPFPPSERQPSTIDQELGCSPRPGWRIFSVWLCVRLLKQWKLPIHVNAKDWVWYFSGESTGSSAKLQVRQGRCVAENVHGGVRGDPEAIITCTGSEGQEGYSDLLWSLFR